MFFLMLVLMVFICNMEVFMVMFLLIVIENVGGVNVGVWLFLLRMFICIWVVFLREGFLLFLIWIVNIKNGVFFWLIGVLVLRCKNFILESLWKLIENFFFLLLVIMLYFFIEFFLLFKLLVNMFLRLVIYVLIW